MHIDTAFLGSIVLDNSRVRWVTYTGQNWNLIIHLYTADLDA